MALLSSPKLTCRESKGWTPLVPCHPIIWIWGGRWRKEGRTVPVWDWYAFLALFPKSVTPTQNFRPRTFQNNVILTFEQFPQTADTSQKESFKAMKIMELNWQKKGTWNITHKIWSALQQDPAISLATSLFLQKRKSMAMPSALRGISVYYKSLWEQWKVSQWLLI